jgi:hypothetical protein
MIQIKHRLTSHPAGNIYLSDFVGRSGWPFGCPVEPAGAIANQLLPLRDPPAVASRLPLLRSRKINTHLVVDILADDGTNTSSSVLTAWA